MTKAKTREGASSKGRSIGPRWTKQEDKKLDVAVSEFLRRANMTTSPRRTKKETKSKCSKASVVTSTSKPSKEEENIDWEAIAMEYMDGTRTPDDCEQRWAKVLKNNLVKGSFTNEEDRIIIQAFEENGPEWNLIAALVPGRIVKQVRDRYCNHLDPLLKRTAWTSVEDDILKEAHEIFGNSWIKIAKLLPGRSETMCKNRWNGAAHKKNQGFGTPGKTSYLANLDQPFASLVPPDVQFTLPSADALELVRNARLAASMILAESEPKEDEGLIAKSDLVKVQESENLMHVVPKGEHCADVPCPCVVNDSYTMGQVISRSPSNVADLPMFVDRADAINCNATFLLAQAADAVERSADEVRSASSSPSRNPTTSEDQTKYDGPAYSGKGTDLKSTVDPRKGRMRHVSALRSAKRKKDAEMAILDDMSKKPLFLAPQKKSSSPYAELGLAESTVLQTGYSFDCCSAVPADPPSSEDSKLPENLSDPILLTPIHLQTHNLLYTIPTNLATPLLWETTDPSDSRGSSESNRNASTEKCVVPLLAERNIHATLDPCSSFTANEMELLFRSPTKTPGRKTRTWYESVMSEIGSPMLLDTPWSAALLATPILQRQRFESESYL